MEQYEISNSEWERIKDKLPAERTGKRGRPAKNNRIMLNGMLQIARFRKWQKDGVWKEIFHTLSSDADMEI